MTLGKILFLIISAILLYSLFVCFGVIFNNKTFIFMIQHSWKLFAGVFLGFIGGGLVANGLSSLFP